MAKDMPRCRPALAPNGKSDGFAYLWLLFSVAVVGLGTSLAMEIHATATQRDKEKELLAIGSQFRQAIGRYYETQIQGKKSEYPNTLEELLLDPRSVSPRRYLRKIYVDPMTGKSDWGLIKFGGKVVGVHSLSEAAPIKLSGFKADDSMLNGKQKYKQWAFTYPPNFIVNPASNGVSVNLPPSTDGSGSPVSAPLPSASQSVSNGTQLGSQK